MNTPVKFEIAKLLKEKGFEERTKSYTEDGKLVTVSLTIRRFNPKKIYYPSPTIAEVVMWLYEKHGIWITPWMASERSWGFHILKTSDGYVLARNTRLLNSPTEAYEAAIEYTLTKLI